MSLGAPNPLTEALTHEPAFTSLMTPDAITRALHITDYLGDAPHRARHAAAHARQLLHTDHLHAQHD